MTTTAAAVVYFSLSDLAHRLDVPKHRVRWILGSRQIAPAVLVGGMPGYDPNALAQIRDALSGIASRR